MTKVITTVSLIIILSIHAALGILHQKADFACSLNGNPDPFSEKLCGAWLKSKF